MDGRGLYGRVGARVRGIGSDFRGVALWLGLMGEVYRNLGLRLWVRGPGLGLWPGSKAPDVARYSLQTHL